MDEFFKNNGPAIIAASSALIGALIAAVAGMVNAFINNRAAKESNDIKFETEKWKLNREIYLNKAELILSLFNEWHLMCLKKHNAQYESCLLQLEDLETYNSIDDDRLEKLQPNIFTLIAIYYSDLMPSFGNIVKTSQALNDLYVNSLVEKEDEKLFLHFAPEQIKGLSMLCEKFIVLLAGKTRDYI